MSAAVLHEIAASVSGRVNMPDVVFFCPGCRIEHGVWTSKPASNGARWLWNGSMTVPTFSPSLHLVYGGNGQNDIPRRVCHCYVRDGNIQFLTDCTHALAGQTVPLPPID